MKIYPSSTTSYRAAGRQFMPVHFISIRAKGLSNPNSTTWFHFCTAEDDMEVEVTRPDTGGTTTRTYLGGGHIVAMGDLVRSQELIRSHSFVLSGVSDTVKDMVLGYDCREALFEWFVGELHENTGLLVDPPTCEMVGLIAPIEIADGALEVNGAEPATSNITVNVDSIGAALTARNYDMRTKDVAADRSNDRFFDYVSNAHHWKVWWAKEKKSEKDRKGGRDKDKDSGTPGFGGSDR